MKKILYMLAIAATAMACITSCKDEEKSEPAEILLEVTNYGTGSIEFEITTENASTYSYAFAKSLEIENAEYTTEPAKNGSPVTISKAGLEADTEYSIRAYATNADGLSSAVATANAKTASSASISIERVAVTPNSITFKLKPMNAVQCSYALVRQGEDAETAALDKKTEDGKEQEITETGLESNSNYTIAAAAVNQSGEESDRAFLTVRTETEPVIEIKSIEPGSDQAKVTVNVSEAVRFAWSYSEKGSEIPDRDAFTKENVSENSDNTFIISGLEENTEYILHIFGITNGGYEGKIISEDFSTTEFIEKSFEITVSNICSTDATISITFDENVYSEYYFIAPSSTYLSDVGTWDWEQKIEDMDDPMASRRIKIKKMAEDCEFKLSEFDQAKVIELEGLYNIGGIPRKKDGTLDESAAYWRQVRLEPAEFGKSGMNLTISDVKPMIDKVGFKISTDNSQDFDCIWLTVLEGSIQDPVEYAKMNTLYSHPLPSFNFEKDTVIEYLSPERDYVISAVARDKSGNLSNVAYESFATNSVTDQGDAECVVSLKEIKANHAIFDLALDPGTSKVLYHYAEKDDYFEEKNFLENLKTGNSLYLEQDGELKLENLSSETDYVFGFCAVGEDGILGKHYLFEYKTSAHEFNGNPEAAVKITIDGVTEDQWGFMAKISAEPNSFVSEYYIVISDADNSKTLTKSVFADRCLRGQYEAYEGPASLTGWDGQGESCGSEATVWVLAIDTEGGLVPIAETRIEETWK